MTIIRLSETTLDPNEITSLFTVFGWEERRVGGGQPLWCHWNLHIVRDDWPEFTIEELMEWLYDHDFTVTINSRRADPESDFRVEVVATHHTGETENTTNVPGVNAGTNLDDPERFADAFAKALAASMGHRGPVTNTACTHPDLATALVRVVLNARGHLLLLATDALVVTEPF